MFAMFWGDLSFGFSMGFSPLELRNPSGGVGFGWFWMIFF